MKKKLLLTLIIISLMFSTISLQGYSTAQTIPSYVGVSEGDVYEWNIVLSNSTIDKIMDDLEGVKDDFKEELNEYGDLNFTEFFKQISIDIFSDILPPNWESLNLTELFEGTIETLVEFVNTEYDLGLTNWKSMNLTAFADQIIEAQGATEDTLFDIIDTIIEDIAAETPVERALPDGWESLTFKELLMWQLNNFMNDLLTYFTGGTFEIPDDWEDLTMSGFMEGIIPGLDSNFIDFILYIVNFTSDGDEVADFLLTWDMEELLNESIYILNETAGADGFPLDLVTCSMSDLLNLTMMGINYDINAAIIPEDWDVLTISELINETLTNINETIEDPGFDILSMNISYCIEFMKMGINQSLYMENFPFAPDITAGEILNNASLELLYAINQSDDGGFYNFSIKYFGVPWYELSINELIDELWEYSMLSFDMLFSEVEELAMLTTGIKLRLNITEILNEAEVVSGLNATQLNYTIHADFGTGEYYDITEDFPFPEDGIWIFDPADLEVAFSDPMEALVYPAVGNLLMFLGSTYDKTQITFKSMQMDMPDPMPNINIDMDWDSNGVLRFASVKYGSATVISISQPGGEIPGYEPIVLIAFSTTSIIGLIYILRRKKIILYKH
ncbi:MAG: hypothetical protein ACQERB_03760 [Promethearchaeati archaeon]